jgi:hypothetical protein
VSHWHPAALYFFNLLILLFVYDLFLPWEHQPHEGKVCLLRGKTVSWSPLVAVRIW